MSIAPLRGFRDFYPEQLAERAFIFAKWREVARRYAFVEYDGPPLEATELYTKKSGDEIVEQLFCFTDKGGRDVALRPEMTPTLARMVAERAMTLRKPVRWFAIPQLFRYETPQRGRLREHFQLNVDIIGEPSIAADAELVACAVDVLRAFGLTSDDIEVRFSDRQLLNRVLEATGITDNQRTVVYAVLDKIHREPESKSLGRLVESGIESSVATQLVSVTRKGGALGKVMEALGVHDIATEEFHRLQEFERRVGWLLREPPEKWLVPDLSIVRGLAYYTGIVFEIFDKKGELRAICGGGRYDGLLKNVGEVDLPALGFGMGDVVLADLLRNRGLLEPASSHAEIWVAAEENVPPERVIQEVARLRAEGHSVEYALRRQSFSKQKQAAKTLGVREIVTVTN